MPFARKKIRQWAVSDREFFKRGTFAMIAVLAVHDKAAGDGQYEPFLQLIKRGSTDDRNFVKKAVSWALRSIGKRDRRLNRRAVAVAKENARMESNTARLMADDALGEMRNLAVGVPVHGRGWGHCPLGYLCH